MTEQVSKKFRDEAFQYVKKQYTNGTFKKPEAEECFAKIGIELKEARKMMAEWRKEGREKGRKIIEARVKQRLEAAHEN
jgi:F0F1-type ATP synthase membrane subunit b/b'